MTKKMSFRTWCGIFILHNSNVKWIPYEAGMTEKMSDWAQSKPKTCLDCTYAKALAQPARSAPLAYSFIASKCSQKSLAVCKASFSGSSIIPCAWYKAVSCNSFKPLTKWGTSSGQANSNKSCWAWVSLQQFSSFFLLLLQFGQFWPFCVDIKKLIKCE